MAWTSPRTWVAGELETAAIFNAHVRDNLLQILSTTGLLTLTNAGIHTISAASAGANRLDVINTTNGTGANVSIRWGAGGSAGGLVSNNAPAYTTIVGHDKPDGTELQGGGAGGLVIYGSHGTTGDIWFYTGASGATVAGKMTHAGGFCWGGTTDPGATNFRVQGTCTFIGSVGTVFFGDGSAASPSHSFISDTNTGFYWIGADQIGMSTGGVLQVTVSSGVLEVPITARGTGNVTGMSVRIGANSSGGGAAGNLNMLTKGSGNMFLWVDATGPPGVFRISTAAPEEDGTPSDTSGTVVGTQVSTLDTKELLGHDLEPRMALATILRTPVKRFRYKGGAYSDTVFHGIIADWSPEFAMDPEPAHPNGRSFNPVSAFGYSVLAMQALDARLRALEG